MARQFRGEVLEGFGGGHEVGLAVDFNDHAEALVEMHVALDHAFVHGTAGAKLLGGLGQAFFAQESNGFFDIAVELFERLLAVQWTGAGDFAQVFNHLSGNCSHVFPRVFVWLSASLSSRGFPFRRTAWHRAAWRGWTCRDNARRSRPLPQHRSQWPARRRQRLLPRSPRRRPCASPCLP